MSEYEGKSGAWWLNVGVGGGRSNSGCIKLPSTKPFISVWFKGVRAQGMAGPNMARKNMSPSPYNCGETNTGDTTLIAWHQK